MLLLADFLIFLGAVFLAFSLFDYLNGTRRS
jgi:hypothetical protein